MSLWFVFTGSKDSTIVPDETAFAATRWWPFLDVKLHTRYSFDPHLPRFIDKLCTRLA
ncbi:MAG: hypothetical protein JJE52_10650 [Acidimicrobiia bacterium]|nr:hypothetical protein [Acidimicrobiia bacterium]